MRGITARISSQYLVFSLLFGTSIGYTQADPGAALRTLIEEERAARTADEPDELDFPPVTIQQSADRAEHARGFLTRLDEIDRTELDRDDQLDWDLLHRDLTSRVMNHEHRAYLTPLNHETGPHASFMRLASRTQFRSLDDYERYLTRLRTAPEYLDQYVTLMREGVSSGRTLPRAVLGAHEGMIDSYLAATPEESTLYEPFLSFPAAVPAAEHDRLRREARTAIAEQVYPGLTRFRDFILTEYTPAARDSYGLLALPGGREYYDHLVRHHTTLDITAEEVHQIGLEEVSRIRAEMEQIIRQVEFEGDFQQFLEFLRTDPRFYAETPEALLREAAYHAKRADGQLPTIFHLKTLPRRPYGVAPVPADLAPNYTGGRYSVANRDDRAGFYWVNTYNLPSRPLYVLPALTLHEAMPGHHLQIALHQEMEGRRRSGVTAYSEGWALYAEYLGKEMGIYDDPYTDFGRLTYEMWRACRLVVDTGIHAKGWTRDQVREFLASNTALSHHEVRTETDRYIAVPGQALAYKMGELLIRRMRAEAEQALGARFDVRDFHHAVLEPGPVTLSVLEENLREWISTASAAPAEASARPTR
jgi:uncharacterized protein (DUF885 family)